MKNYILFLTVFLVACNKPSENKPEQNQDLEPLSLTVINEIPALPITQQISGTCWAFSTTSFFESEIYRMEGCFINLSAMYFVYNVYMQKAQNYILRQGAARFTEGGCNYDPLIDIDRLGLMPHGAYSGDTIRDHRNLITELTTQVKDFANPENKLGGVWRLEVPAILDKYIGRPAETFLYKDSIYTPKDFLKYTGLKADDYINLTSFTHAPQNQYFVLEIPANWSSRAYFNVPLDEYIDNIDHALESGYSLAIDMDLVEPEVFIRQGFALMHPDSIVTPERRQADFESFATTDDHNMHLVGKVKDQHGNIYYKCKNSWGKEFGIDGHYYLSDSYLRSKSIYVMLHKDGLMESTRKKIVAN